MSTQTTNYKLVKPEYSDYADITVLNENLDIIDEELYGKVDKVTGKGLSKNDFTDTLKEKLDGIASGAEVNVQPDWNQSSPGADDFIKNKPTIPTVPSNVSSFTNDAGYIKKTDSSGTLTVAGWSNKEQTLSMAGLTASKSIIVSVDSTDSDGYDAAKNSNIRLSARGTGTLTFAVDTVPTDAITILVTIFE